MDHLRSKSTMCFIEHGALAEIGRMLTWLGENCETFSLRITAPQRITRANEAMSIQVAFNDGFEAAAFRRRFTPPVDQI